MERKSRAQAESFGFIAVVVVGLVLINLLAIKFYHRWDLTKRHLFTLSDGTRNIIQGHTDHTGHTTGGLHDQLTITTYFTPNQPPPHNDDERILRDQLEEYQALRPDRVHLRFVTVPISDTTRTHEADQAGCVKGSVQGVDQTQHQATRVEAYRCITFDYLGSHQKIDFMESDVAGLEYELSSIIKNISAPANERDRTIGFLSGHGELTPEEGLQYLPQVLEQSRVPYHTRAINLTNGTTEVPADIKGLIILNPTRQIPEQELRRLDQYLMRGGSIAVFAGGVNFTAPDPGEANGTVAVHHLNDWLQGYGLEIQPNVVLDLLSADGAARMGRFIQRVKLVTWPIIMAFSGQPTQADLVAQGGLDPQFPAVFRLSEFVAPYISSIRTNPAIVRQGGGELHVFARTSPHSVPRTGDFALNVVEIFQQGRETFENPREHGPYAIGLSLEGRFRSAYASQNPVTGGGSGDAGVPPAAGGGDAGTASSPVVAPERAVAAARLMVVGTGQLFGVENLRAMMQMSQGRPSNLLMLLNTFDWLTQDFDLLAVRAKDLGDPTLRTDVSAFAQNSFQWGATAVLPLAIGLLGVVIMVVRRNRRQNYLRDYKSVGG